MAEIYIGTKFKYIQKNKEISKHKDLKLLKEWCNIFNKKNFAPTYEGGSSGNLSFRSQTNSNNFIITASHTALNSSMTNSDFFFFSFSSIANNTIHANGNRAPSSESLMHYLIYKNRPEVNAIFHGHSDNIMKLAREKGFPETELELPYGTIELAKDVTNTLKNYSFVILKNHGFISVGKTQEETGNRVLKLEI